ncbi:MAG: riboflavin biosynthesis protein RibF [Clostridia bacterium]|nr:riboflavin biosynthesis protein RibF [Clostridia bacterium]
MRVTEYKLGNSVRCDGSHCDSAAVCLGFFDGVHLGHRALVEECVRYAIEHGLVPTVFTFPSECASLKGGAPRIYPTEEKLALLSSLGVEHTVLADFESVSGLSPREFVKQVLLRDVGAATAHSGFSFRFGRGASGDFSMLSALMAEYGRACFAVGDVTLLDATVSSTRIREALASGDISLARKLLGEPYFISGQVIHGDGRGHLFGYPTVNTALSDHGLLPSGVYKTELDIDGVTYSALTNVGTCPTFGERERHAETLILGYSGDLYGRVLKIRFLEFLRQEKKFESTEELLKTIEKDIKGIE